MASARIKLDTRRADENGNYPAKIIIVSNQTNASISLNCCLPEKAWLGDGIERPVKASHPGAKAINDTIQSLYIEIRQKISELELSGWTKNTKASDIKNRVLSDRSTKPVVISNFSTFANKYISDCKTTRTKEIYSNTIKQMTKFAGKESIEFCEITNPFLRQFDDFLSKSNIRMNTRAIHFRNIRAIFNRAIDDDVIGQEHYPFRKFKIKGEEKNKVSLSPEQLKKLYEYEFETSSLGMARDYFMLSFFLCGINPVDMFNLKKPDSENRVSFVRKKMQSGIHNTIRLLIQPEAQQIMDRYRNDDESPYLLCFIDKYVSYDIFKSFLARKIREIPEIVTGKDDKGKDIKPFENYKGMTMYWARYSWATIADSLDIPEKTISKGLGHVDKSMAGRKYIAYDWSKVDKANRSVIDFVL